jgi:hypothetical protein
MKKTAEQEVQLKLAICDVIARNLPSLQGLVQQGLELPKI